jgi:hypothetical protein
MALLELDMVKNHLKLELEDSSQDAELEALMAAAERACELRTGRAVDPGQAPIDSLAVAFTPADLALLRQGALLMIGDWFGNREGEGTPSRAVCMILDSLQDYSDR